VARKYDTRKLYLLLMGSCITLIVLAWFVVRLFSIPAAIAMSAVAAVLPPTAAIVANWGHDKR
jgi:hypothetical protein